MRQNRVETRAMKDAVNAITKFALLCDVVKVRPRTAPRDQSVHKPRCTWASTSTDEKLFDAMILVGIPDLSIPSNRIDRMNDSFELSEFLIALKTLYSRMLMIY
jgi:hypothetical protein